jgi:ceramide glucosyltransferase
MLRDILGFAALLLLAGSAAGAVYLVAAAIAVRRFAARPPTRGGTLPPVSVLKPLCGEDWGLLENLDSFCRQDYPRWQIVFGVQDPRDPAIAIVAQLRERFPAADLSLVGEGGGRAGNLKIANLQNMLPAARHDLLVIADSDMRVQPSYLAEVTAPLSDPAIGLVTCLYRGIPAGGFWSRLACLHVNHGFLPQAVFAAALGTDTGCFGATLALRRETLEAVGGLAAIADALADDHALGLAVRRLGRRVLLSSCIVDNVIAEPGLAALFRHELRWARTILMVAPLGFVGSVITHPLALSGLAVLTGAWPIAAPALLVLSFAVRALTIRQIDAALRLPPTPLWLIPARDLLSFAVFVASFFARRVAWRDRTFRLGPKGRLILDGDRPA